MSAVTKPRRVKLTPADHGREIDPDLFEHSTGEPGYKYEIIDGRVYVSPLADLSHEDLIQWLLRKFFAYADAQPEVVRFISPASRTFVTARERATVPEPDIAIYTAYPTHLPRRERHWRGISPVVVIEVVSDGTADKDYVRNPALYLDVPTVREYWVLDPRPDPDRPALVIYRRRGLKWQKPITVPFGDAYETPRVLPGFRLVLDPDQ